MTTPTHWWMYKIEVQNEFQGIRGCIHYSWWSPVATAFEAYWVSGPRKRSEGWIKIILNDQVVGTYTTKSEALDVVRRLISNSPSICREDFLRHGDRLYYAIEALI